MQSLQARGCLMRCIPSVQVSCYYYLFLVLILLLLLLRLLLLLLKQQHLLLTTTTTTNTTTAWQLRAEKELDFPDSLAQEELFLQIPQPKTPNPGP